MDAMQKSRMNFIARNFGTIQIAQIGVDASFYHVTLSLLCQPAKSDLLDTLRGEETGAG